VYLVLVVGGRLEYRRFLYPAPGGETLLPLPDGATLWTLAAKDGVPVHALQLAPPAGKAVRTIVLFHGSGERMEWEADLGELLRSRGFAVVLAEFRGYGRSRGDAEPDEAGLYLDAEAIVDAVVAQGTPEASIVLWGTSLGTGVAAEMARRGRGAALILASPYTSIRAVGAHHVPILPMRLVIPDRYDTLGKAAAIHVPTLVVHGTQDEVIPFAMGEEVSRAIMGARLVAVPGAHHNDLYSVGGDALLRELVHFAATASNGAAPGS
jgi:pimeloyl-ACP methyl ester carboxylesterase